MEMNKYPICSNQEIVVMQVAQNLKWHIECPICGKYNISFSLASSDINRFGEIHLISGAIRNLSEKGKEVELNEESIKNLLTSISVPSDPFESIDFQSSIR